MPGEAALRSGLVPRILHQEIRAEAGRVTVATASDPALVDDLLSTESRPGPSEPLRRALQRVEGISRATVNLAEQSLTVDWCPAKLPLSQVFQQLDRRGFHRGVPNWGGATALGYSAQCGQVI